MIALDPDIPFEQQRVEFRADGAAAAARWLLNGTPLDGAPYWRPLAGHWRLALVDASGTLLDEVEFDVRGGGAADGSTAGPSAAGHPQQRESAR